MKDNFDIFTDNFDTDGITQKAETIPQRDNDDYGDDFESQTGENTEEYHGRADYSDDFSEYRGNRKKSNRTKNGGMQNEKALIFAAAIVIGIIAGVLVFVLMQCDDGNKTPSTTKPTTYTVATQKKTEPAQQYQEETSPYYEEETTQAPTEAPTTEYIEPTTQYVEETTQVFTEAPTEATTVYVEEPTDEEIQSEIEETTKQIV